MNLPLLQDRNVNFLSEFYLHHCETIIFADAEWQYIWDNKNCPDLAKKNLQSIKQQHKAEPESGRYCYRDDTNTARLFNVVNYPVGSKFQLLVITLEEKPLLGGIGEVILSQKILTDVMLQSDKSAQEIKEFCRGAESIAEEIADEHLRNEVLKILNCIINSGNKISRASMLTDEIAEYGKSGLGVASCNISKATEQLLFQYEKLSALYSKNDENMTFSFSCKTEDGIFVKTNTIRYVHMLNRLIMYVIDSTKCNEIAVKLESSHSYSEATLSITVTENGMPYKKQLITNAHTELCLHLVKLYCKTYNAEFCEIQTPFQCLLTFKIENANVFNAPKSSDVLGFFGSNTELIPEKATSEAHFVLSRYMTAGIEFLADESA
jgi:hypothetical protein